MSEQPIRDAPGEPIAFEAYDIGVGPDAPLGANSEYAQAAHRVEAWLEDRARSCIYPRDCLQPMREEHLLSGYLEPTNEPYAIAKIAGIKLCESYNRQYGTKYRAVMPTNLYGPGDNFDLENSHVLPA